MRSLLRAEDRRDLEAPLDALRPGTHRRWGRMSVEGMVCHLTDSFLAVLGERPAGRVPKLHERTLMRWIALSTPVPWPKGVPTIDARDQERGGTPPESLEPDKARLRQVIDRFLVGIEAGTMAHPLFGEMSAAEWGRWAYRHMDHHFRQFSA